MTDSRYNKLVARIFWFTLPLIISLLTFLVVNVFKVEREVSNVVIKNQSGIELQEKIWSMLQENNGLLKTKADEEANDRAHAYLMTQLNNVENKVDKIYNRKFDYGFVPKIDTSLDMLAKNNNKLDTIIDCASNMKNILETKLTYQWPMVPFKEPAIVQNIDLAINKK
jgi:hypothetical protein